MKIFNLYILLSFICFSVNAQNYTDKINVKKGQTIEVISNITQILEMGMEMKTTSTITSNFKVLDVTDSEFKVQSHITKIKSSAEVMGMPLEYDSEKPDSENNPEMSESLKAKLNVEKEFLINRTTLLGTDLTKFDSKDENPVNVLMDAADINESATAMEMFFLIPKGKKAGDSWTTTSDANGNKIENNYTLKEVKDGIAYVDFKISFNVNRTINSDGTDVAFNIKVISTGNLSVSTETGIVKKKSINSVSDGNMSVQGNESTLSSNTTVESIFNIK